MDDNKLLCQKGLRERLLFNITIGGYVRAECLFKMKISDLFMLQYPDEQLILGMLINQGKVNEEVTMFGRMMRSADPIECPINALAMYLFSRVHFGGEKWDFSSNVNWFHIFLLIKEGSNTPEVVSDHNIYAKVVKDMLDALDLSNFHKEHIGRELGSIMGGLRGLKPEEIKQIGNWNAGVWERVYASKFPAEQLVFSLSYSV